MHGIGYIQARHIVVFKSSVLLFVQNRGINLLGVNTRSDRESSPGYKDNYVKCSCSEVAIFNVVRDLEAIGAVRIKVGTTKSAIKILC